MVVEVEKKAPLEIKTTRVFKDCLEAWCGGFRRLLEEGGTSSSKTWSILQFLIYLATEAESPMLFSVVSESLPHLKRGCIRDFFAILGESQDSNPFWSKTEDKVFGELTEVGLLVVDDVGKVARSDPRFVQSTWFKIIDKRYASELPIVLTCNLNYGEFFNHFGGQANEATYSRLMDMAKGNSLEIDSPSYRNISVEL